MNPEINEFLNKIKENMDFTTACEKLKQDINSFLRTNFDTDSLESFGFELKDVSKDKAFELHAPNKAPVNADLMVLMKDKLDKRHCLVTIELIPSVDYLKHFSTEKSIAILHAANEESDYPVLHLITNLVNQYWVLFQTKSKDGLEVGTFKI